MDETFARSDASWGGLGWLAAALMLCFVALNAGGRPAHAAELRFSRMMAPDVAVYRLDGVLLHDDGGRLGPVIDGAAKSSKYVLIELDSPGGDLVAAMEIGRIFRRHLFWTQVADVGRGCYSACVLVLAGGATRIARSDKLGIHRPRFDPAYFANLDAETARRRYASMAASVRSYLDEMGIAPRLFDMMMQVSSSSVRFLTQEELEETGLDGFDPAYDEWIRARDDLR